MFRPKLPPKLGYVEVEDENGNRIYKKVETEQDKTIELLLEEKETSENYILELDYRLSLMELGVI